MPRTYKRVGLVPPPSNENLKKALDDILSGKFSINQTAKNHGLSKTTLARYAKLHQGCGFILPLQVKRPQFHLQILSSEMERELSEYLLTCSLFNHGLTTIDTRKIAFSFAVANSLKTLANWHINGMASKDWLSGFTKRNQHISIRKPESTSQARACGFNKPVVSGFYDQLFNVQDKYQFSADRVFNCDETSDTTVMDSPNVIAQKGAKQVQQTVSAERGENVTMLAFISAEGKSIPPVFIFPRKKLKP
ncbi:uncharacterized protein LOC116918404 [Daphnia magna]|uniref:uncharacterized protein LOC116918404 n=1 Tax=Daphnia magna TaxID=35525 RepID=UPI001E1BACC7|nr:uncharacterized protein LOC116918404 [Daphnia magna]